MPFISGHLFFPLISLYPNPKSALKKIFNLKGCPVRRVWAWNSLVTMRMMKVIVNINRPTASKTCHKGTALPVARRVIMMTGAVRGKRLNPVAMGPLGSLIKTPIISKARMRGLLTTKAAWAASRKFGTSAPIPAIRLA